MTTVNTLLSGGQGTAVPSGFVGSYYTAGGTGGTISPASSGYKNMLSLTPSVYGVYLVTGQGAYFVSGSSPTGFTYFGVAINNSSSTSGGSGGTGGFITNPQTVNALAQTLATTPQIFIINASNPTLYLNVLTTYTTQNGLTLDLNESYLQAVRLA